MKNGRKRSRNSRKRSENPMCWYFMCYRVNMPTKTDFWIKSSNERYFTCLFVGKLNTNDYFYPQIIINL